MERGPCWVPITGSASGGQGYGMAPCPGLVLAPLCPLGDGGGWGSGCRGWANKGGALGDVARMSLFPGGHQAGRAAVTTVALLVPLCPDQWPAVPG